VQQWLQQFFDPMLGPDGAQKHVNAGGQLKRERDQ
jgi:hypothetical protein